ncbi:MULTISPECIES: hypothetical protein [Sinorhizobium]|uniref:Uncharacterized protein n=1 Tax=Sinorhizobium kummerowiae TaxID=158892 RepID=A0ABY8TFJ2_9HYPH|nr:MULTISPECIES: hypothetical protein [Sinorhizobium]WHS96084.1 hypothetical protein PZL22_004915 [Sinorhizobium kummerowiae]WQH41966.1 hypothetical protein VPK21_000610 [Sinorhizobium kummerowiae]
MIREDILQRFGLLAFRLERTNYPFGDTFGVADPYLFILARGAQELGFPLSACFRDYVARIEARPTVRGQNGVKRFPRLLPRNYEASALKRPNSTGRRTTAPNGAAGFSRPSSADEIIASVCQHDAFG